MGRKVKNNEKIWQKGTGKRIATWVHRYLRLHAELLEDAIYKDIYDYHRGMLIACLKRKTKKKRATDEDLGELADVLANIFNRSSPDRVNAYKPLVDTLYTVWRICPEKNCE